MEIPINNKTEKHMETLTIKEVANKIKLKKDVATKKWLNQNNIQIFKIGNKNIVYQIDVESALEKRFALNLKSRHPENWENIYRNITTNDIVFKMVTTEINGYQNKIPTTKIKPKLIGEKKLINRLIK